MDGTSLDLRNIEHLEALLVVLRKHGVAEYSSLGTSLRLTIAPVAVSAAVSAHDGPKPPATPTKPASPELQAAFDRLPDGYKRMFEPR